ncbi:MAG: hypothetical protein ABR610_11675 [Thermoanaerobaculia bacterium]
MADEVHLVRDILDKQLVDRDRRLMGKADGIVLRMRGSGPPEVVAIEAGPGVLADRLHPGLGRRLCAALERLGKDIGQPLRIPFAKILHRGLDLQIDTDARRTSAYAAERWLKERVVRQFPGSGE